MATKPEVRGGEMDGLLSHMLTARAWLRARPIVGFVLAISAFMMCLCIRLLLPRFGVEGLSPFALFAPAIVVAPILGGLWAGLAVVVLTTASGVVFFLPPRPASTVALIAYLLSVTVVIVVVATLEMTIERLLKERQRSEQLLHEVRHRTANNFQTLSTILRMHQRQILDEEGRSALLEADRRVATMGLLHRRLSHEADEDLWVGPHLQALCTEVIGAAGSSSIIWRVNAPDGLLLPPARMLSLSLIVNEIITNALKYAFPPGGSGQLTIDLIEKGSDLVLVVDDNGVGMIHDRGTGGLGTTIVSSLAQQLGGRAEWRAINGTTFTLQFPRVEA